MEPRKASAIENKILDAIYGIRSRRTDVPGEAILLLGPDEYAELRAKSEVWEHQNDSFFGYPIRVTSTPGISFAWSTYWQDAARVEMEWNKEDR